MSITLEIVLTIAAIVFTVLAICLIPLAFLAWRQLVHLALSVDLLKGNVEVLVRDSRELVRDMTELSRRANRQMDDVGKVVHTAEVWTERADWLAKQVGGVIESPVASVARKAGIVKVGVTAFLRALTSRSKQKRAEKESENG